VASYTVNGHAVAHARRLIDAHQYVLRSVWNEVQPSASAENAFLESHSWDDYSAWYLGLTEGAADETKASYAFVYGDFRRLHRMGLIACHYRAAEWGHKKSSLPPTSSCSTSIKHAPDGLSAASSCSPQAYPVRPAAMAEPPRTTEDGAPPEPGGCHGKEGVVGSSPTLGFGQTRWK
jgi:hypothetical protein